MFPESTQMFIVIMSFIRMVCRMEKAKTNHGNQKNEAWSMDRKIGDHAQG